MSQGRLDNAVVKATNCHWEAKTSKKGKDNVNLRIDFVDSDDTEHEVEMFLSSQRFVQAEDGKLITVSENENFKIGGDTQAGRFLQSLDTAGFSRKILKNIGDDIDQLDGQWMRVKQEPTGQLKDNGEPFTNLVVAELIDENDAPGGSGKKNAKESTTSKTPKKEAEEEEKEEEESKSKEGEKEEDETTVEARNTMLVILADPKAAVKNYDPEANGGGITIKQAYVASFTNATDKKLKGPIGELINDPDFHKENAANELYAFDAKKGVITANKRKNKK